MFWFVGLGISEIVLGDLDVMLSKMLFSEEALLDSLGSDEVRSPEEPRDCESLELEGPALITSDNMNSSIGIAVFS